mgnify:CR=1 FL=1
MLNFSFFFFSFLFFFTVTATTEIYTLSLHDALPILIPIHGWSRLEDGEGGEIPGLLLPQTKNQC